MQRAAGGGRETDAAAIALGPGRNQYTGSEVGHGMCRSGAAQTWMLLCYGTY